MELTNDVLRSLGDEVLEVSEKTLKKNRAIRDRSDEREREIELGGRAEFFELRRKWSTYLFWFLVATLAFQFFVAISIGFGLIKYDSSTVTAVLLTESFVQIVGLVFLVVKFLFSPGDR